MPAVLSVMPAGSGKPAAEMLNVPPAGVPAGSVVRRSNVLPLPATRTGTLGRQADDVCVGADVGTGVGADVGAEVGAGVGAAVGAGVGVAVGAVVGAEVGAADGADVGAAVGEDVGATVGAAVGALVGALVGDAGLVVGAVVVVERTRRRRHHPRELESPSSATSV